jgi:hypothetical protein
VHLLVGQHRLHIAGQVGIQCSWSLEVLGCQHRDHPGTFRASDLSIFGRACATGERNDHVQHARHLDVVDVVALALDEARALMQAAVAHALQRRRSSRSD